MKKLILDKLDTNERITLEWMREKTPINKSKSLKNNTQLCWCP